MSLKQIWGKICPASKQQVNNQAKEVEQNLKKELAAQDRKMTRRLQKMDNNANARLERIEKMLMMQYGGVTQKKRNKQIIVALTSYPKRIYEVDTVIERFLNQTLKPDRVVLYLAEDNFPEGEAELPQRLLDMRNQGLEIHWCKQDIKSYKKLIPALLEYPDEIIITADDDIYYELDVVENLYDSYRKFPKAVSALRVHKMNFEKDRILPYAKWNKCTSEISNVPSMKLFATTGGGTLFPPHVLYRDTTDEKLFTKLCPNADDVWIKFMMVLNETPVVLAGNCVKIKCIDGTQEERLWDINIQENDTQIQNVLRYYEDFRIEEKRIEAYLAACDRDNN